MVAHLRDYLALVVLCTLLVTAVAEAARKSEALRVVAGTGRSGYSGDRGPAAQADLNSPLGVTERKGSVYIADSGNGRVRVVDRRGRIRTLVGDPAANPRREDAARPRLQQPVALLHDRDGDLFIADSAGASVLKADSDGRLAIYAGNGRPGSSADGGPAAESPLQSPAALAFDRAGNLYIGDDGDNRIRRVDAKTGVITTVAGTGRRASERDGDPARQTSLNGCRALAVNRRGELLILERDGTRVRRIDAETGLVGSLSGRRGTRESDPLEPLRFTGAQGLHVDEDGHVFVADTGANRVIRVDGRSALVTVVAGEGSPVEGRLDRPTAVWRAGNRLLIADAGSHRILSVPLRR